MHIDIGTIAFSFDLRVLDSSNTDLILANIVKTDKCVTTDIQSIDKLLYLKQGQRCHVNLSIHTQLEQSAKHDPDRSSNDKGTVDWSLFTLEPTSKSFVAFSVQRIEQEQKDASNMSVSQILTFTDVALNANSGWNPTSNRFIAPILGVYMFSYHVAGVRWATVSLVVNNQAQYTVQASINCFDGVDTASRFVPVKLSQGELNVLRKCNNMLLMIAFHL